MEWADVSGPLYKSCDLGWRRTAYLGLAFSQRSVAIHLPYVCNSANSMLEYNAFNRDASASVRVYVLNVAYLRLRVDVMILTTSSSHP